MSLKEKFTNNKQRYITAIVLLACLVFILIINNVFLIWVVLGIVFLLGFAESIRLFDCRSQTSLYVFAVFVWILAGFNGRPIESAIFVAMIMAGILAYKKSFDPKQILPFIYPTIPFLTLYSIYKDFGLSAIVWLIVIVVLTDVGAFFGGKTFGKTPFSSTSPNKTLEGAVIGLVVAVTIGSFVGLGSSGGFFITSLLVSFAISLSAIFGDLFESYLKRNANLKDSGKILPGHGGVLDRMDAMLFGSITMHFLLYFLDIWKTNSIVFI